MKIYVATLSTDNFSFEAYGQTADLALMALVGGLRKHTVDYKITDTYWYGDMLADIVTREVEMGEAYRDRELIKP